MPSQRPIIIPPYAILDPAFCDEWGKPLFAWHSNAGKISIANSGIAYNKGAVSGIRGLTAGTLVARAQGGISFPGNPSNGIDFGAAPALKLTTNFSMFVQAKPAVTTLGSTIMGCAGASGVQGIGIGLSSTGLIIVTCSSGASTRYISSQSYNTTIQTFGCAVTPNVAWNGVYRNGILLTNGTGAGTPVTPTFSTNWFFSTVAQPYSGLIYQGVLWARIQPQRLFEILDVDPSKLWWWPGKNHDRTFSIPVGGTTFTATLSASAGNSVSRVTQAGLKKSVTSGNNTSKVMQASLIRSGSSANATSKVMQAQPVKSVTSSNVSTVQKVVQAVRSASSVSVASLIKFINTVKSVTSGNTSTIAILKVKTLILIATCGNSVNLVRSTLKQLSVSSGNTVISVRSISKTLTAIGSNSASCLKMISKTLLANCANAATTAVVNILYVVSGLIIAVGNGYADVISRLGFRGDFDGGSGDGNLRSGGRDDFDGGSGDANSRGGGKG